MATESNSNTFNSEFRKVIDPLGANLDQVDSSAKHTLGTHARDSRGGVYINIRIGVGQWRHRSHIKYLSIPNNSLYYFRTVIEFFI